MEFGERDLNALDAKHAEEFIPKGFGFGILRRARPILRKGDGVVTEFIPRNGHRKKS